MPSHPGSWAVVLSLSAVPLFLFRTQLRWVSLFLLAIGFGLHSYQQRLHDRLDPMLAGEVLKVQGTVSSIPQDLGELLRFRFQPFPGGNEAGLPETLLVSWYREWPEMRLGQQWQLELRVKPPWGSVNFSGVDKERWLFSEGIGGTGSVRSGELLESPVQSPHPVQDIRKHIQVSVSRLVQDHRERAVLTALATAERSGIDRDDNRLLKVTGTAHLLAISGLHVGLAAAGGALLFRGILWVLPLARTGRSAYYFSILGGVVSATAYTALANLGVSTLRALLMLVAVMIAMATARNIHAVRSLTVALALVLLVNPFAPLGAGFWFSFLAVFALVCVFQPRWGHLPWWKTLLIAQAAVFLVMLPVSTAWLHGFSLTGFLANLVAIPWVSLLVVPPVLAGILALPLLEPVSAIFWSLAGISVSGLFHVLKWFGQVQPFLLPLRDLSLAGLAIAVGGALLLLLPAGLKIRWVGVFLLLPLFLPARSPARDVMLQLDVLDVGQGTSVVVSTSNHLLLYDTGPGNGAGLDYVSSSIAPVVSELRGGSPDLIVVSHGDLDHAGGLHSARKRFPESPVLGSTRGQSGGIGKCTEGTEWSWDGFRFRVLHPSEGLPYLRNNSSCVLSIRNAVSGLLLSGDIEGFVENRLLLDGLGEHALLIVPHHGSRSSSGEAFINTVAPSVAIATASLGNRFGFPRDEIRTRYERRGARFWPTGECGGLRVAITPDGGLTASSARRERRRIWRWPAAKNCP